ncbi:CBS domain-containing protein [Pelagicoccus sp. NFK12]|uniref:CBS domain-containing protein n=1 Tax=Pelagicoccus enzymogenes TaxID=2773457 RepID=A0A927FBC7_9BACT|nr:CBS domain-containing protein [Pelagicoccus enzymogenes]MBD5781226.1 CBS domain-containing protein [Pelagicoccus enzymogenes]MDQ8198872.1 CBS domain-containing protein [Pelagicoccus enzymogenes]
MQTAADLMTKRFLRISTEHNLKEALALLLYGEQHKAETAAIAVIDEQGNLAGILTPECVVAGLSGLNAHLSQEALSEAVERNYSLTVGQVMKKGIPTATKETPLSELLLYMRTGKHECIPVIEESSVIGLVYVSDLFKQVAQLALTEEDQGIQM